MTQGDVSRAQAAVSARKEARAILERMPTSSPHFPERARQVAWVYQTAGLGAQAHAILEGALAKTGPQGESHSAHVAMLNALADFWRQDGNLLKAAAYLEEAATSASLR